MRWALSLFVFLVCASGCGQTGVGGLDPVVIRLERLELRWVYGQEEPGGDLSVRVEVEFDEPRDLCILPETGIEQVHRLSRWPLDDASDLPLSTQRSTLKSYKVGKAVRGLTFAGPVSGAVPKEMQISLRIFNCGRVDVTGQEISPVYRFAAPEPALVPIWRTTFKPTDD
jgi:hypothetical protein